MAAELALPHRRRRDPFDDPGLDPQQLDEAMAQTSGSGATTPIPTRTRPAAEACRRSDSDYLSTAGQFVDRQNPTQRRPVGSLPNPDAGGSGRGGGRTGAAVARP